ncbi:probable inactive purple acid phosphatase 27 [Impatiens glandulifera]|uniref:probable inactive purple acid phosphatase 27 n=1 Tax=Impatiens glandulifera TaxID=253017 RepID=UPI001FB10C8E|nr:probable inactive purple acid phosphatase 27 [Impatiens glandulifera]
MVVPISWDRAFISVLIISIYSYHALGLSFEIKKSEAAHRDHTAISEFRLVNRRELRQCNDPNPYLEITVGPNSKLADEQFISVTVSGVLFPNNQDWIGMISPSSSNISTCLLSKLQYAQTGDLSNLPLLCHYPVKAQFVSKDPDYLSCKNKVCQRGNINKNCLVRTCNGTVSFHVVNIRTDIEFVFFGSGFTTPCILKRSSPLSFANPNKPLYPHLSSLDSSATKMRLTWVSGDNKPQQVLYGKNNLKAISQVTTFSKNDMCSSALASPAKDFGWHEPGFIHTAVMNGLTPSTANSYKFGGDSVGWSETIKFKTPPAGGSSELKFLAYGDMGKTPLDESVEHYIQPGAVSVVKAMVELESENVDSVFHIGDISYATGFLVEWDFFLSQITPLASKRSYMTAIGNHERDYASSGSVYQTPDSGGECGVAYETYFPMPTPGKDKPWYSIEQGPVHFTVISTEHNWNQSSEQYNWMKNDMAAVNRSRTPWLIFTGHRPMYSSTPGILGLAVDQHFVNTVEPLLLNAKVDLALWGHVHNYERTCAVYEKVCKAMPKKDRQGVDVYNGFTYTAPVHAVIGMAGFNLDSSSASGAGWSLVRKSKYGYSRVHATKTDLTLEVWFTSLLFK